MCAWCVQHEAAQRGELPDDAPQPVMSPPWQRSGINSVSLSRVLVGINILVYFAMGIVGGGLFSDPTPQQLISSGGNYGPLTFGGEWWRLLSYAFLHSNLLHIAFNMWCLWDLGALCESLYGTWTFASLYFVSAVAGGLASVGVHPERLSVGASGAIFGLAGALIAGFYLGEFTLPRPVIQAQLRSMIFFVGYNIIIGALSGPTDNLCHLGGLVAGIFCGGLIARFAPAERDAMPRLTILGFAVLALAGITFGLERSRGYVIHVRHGNELLIDRRYDEAIAELQTAVHMRPNYLPARLNLARAYFSKQQFAKAEAELKHVLELDPDNDDALYFLGFCYLADQHAPDAKQVFSRLIARNPKVPGAHYGLGMALAAEGNHRDAIDEFKTTATLRPGFEGVHYQLGLAQAELGLYDDAIVSFQNEIANTDDYDAEIALAHAYEKKGMHQKAVEAMERAQRLKGQK